MAGKIPLLFVKGVSKSFGRKSVLRDVSLDVQEGEILALVGVSGGGKTTLLKILSGCLGVDSGDVKFRYDCFSRKKHSVSKGPVYASVYSENKLARNLFGFASQEPSFYAKLNVKENLEYFGSLYNLPAKALETNIDVLVSLMDLKSCEKTLAENLSGGMERRLDIACALIHDPEILILDEPTSDLDPVLREHVWSLVKKINRKGTTIVLASHHLSEVENFCSRVAILNNGRILDVDTPARLKNKYSDSQQIKIQTYPGSYSNIVKSFKHPGGKVFDAKIRGSELIIHSDAPQAVIHELLHVLSVLKEELVDINVSRPGLDELFLKITSAKERIEKKK